MGKDRYGRWKGCNVHGAAIEEGYRFHRQSVFRKWPAIGLDDEAACRAMLRSCTRMSIEDGYRFHPKRYWASAVPANDDECSEASLLMDLSNSPQAPTPGGLASALRRLKSAANRLLTRRSPNRPDANRAKPQHGLKSLIVGIVDLCAEHPWWVILLAAVLAAGSGVYAGARFAIRTDNNMLISTDLPWRPRQEQFLEAFPQRKILVVIDAPTPELVEQAAAKLAQALATHSDLIRSARQTQSGSFFTRNGFLYVPIEEVARGTDGFTQADAVLEPLA